MYELHEVVQKKSVDPFPESTLSPYPINLPPYRFVLSFYTYFLPYRPPIPYISTYFYYLNLYYSLYRGKNKPFTITSSTAYDQKFIYGRNIYSNIDYLVDSIFANYLSRPGVRQPILTSYCDGRRVTCEGLSQWGSKYLGDEGYSAIEIIRYYYGNDMYINTAQAVSGVPSSYPGYTLTVGSSGQKVYQLQEQLNRIARNFPAIPRINADGIYGPATAEAVRTFQSIFDLPATGNTDYPTWYSISDIYVGVSRIAEPGQ